MNPVTLKELRQLTRSRTIAGAIVGFFLVQLLAAALVVVAETNSHGALDDDCGEMVFAWLAALLGPILAFVVPGNIFSRLVSEHGPGRAELLCATALRPSALVDGKIRSGLAMLALFLAGALPFLLCSYLLGGVDVLFVLSWTLAVAVCASTAVHLSLFLGSLRLSAPFRWCIWAFCAIPCIPFALLSANGYEELDWNKWGWLSIMAGLFVTANFLLRGLAIALVAPPATDRVRPLRLTVSGLLFVWLAVAVAASLFAPGAGTWADVREAFSTFGCFAGFVILPLAAFDLSSPPGPTRRVLLDRPRSRLRRLLRFPFSTGAESGLAFAILFLGFAFLCVAFGWPDPVPANVNLGGIAALCVLWIYLLAALLLARAILRIPPLARRNAQRFTAIGAMAIVALAMIVPNLLAIGSNSFDANLSPFNLAGIDFDDWIKRTSTHPGGPGDNLLFHARWAVSALLVGLLLHVRPFLRSLRAYVLAPDARGGVAPGPAADAKPAPRGRGEAVARAEGTSE